MAKQSVTRCTLVLLLVCALCGVMITLTKNVTDPVLNVQQQKAQEAAYRHLLPKGATFNLVDVEAGKVTAVQRALDENRHFVGYIYHVNVRGYADQIKMLVGISYPDGKIQGVKILDQKETPGLGANCVNENFLKQFRGYDTTKKIKVSKDYSKGKIQAITSATLTSRAIVDGVNAARAHYDQVFGKGVKK